MDNERKVYKNQPEGTRVRGRPENRWIACVLSKKSKIRKWKKQSMDRGMWRGSNMDAKVRIGCSANEEDK
jgi:hypothetical protein